MNPTKSRKQGRTRLAVTLALVPVMALSSLNTTFAIGPSKVIDVKELRKKGIFGTTKDFQESSICTYWKMLCVFKGKSVTQMHPDGKPIVNIDVQDYHLIDPDSDNNNIIGVTVFRQKGRVTSAYISLEDEFDIGIVEKFLYSITPAEDHSQALDFDGLVRTCKTDYDAGDQSSQQQVMKYKGKTNILSCEINMLPGKAMFMITVPN